MPSIPPSRSSNRERRLSRKRTRNKALTNTVPVVLRPRQESSIPRLICLKRRLGGALTDGAWDRMMRDGVSLGQRATEVRVALHDLPALVRAADRRGIHVEVRPGFDFTVEAVQRHGTAARLKAA